MKLGQAGRQAKRLVAIWGVKKDMKLGQAGEEISSTLEGKKGNETWPGRRRN